MKKLYALATLRAFVLLHPDFLPSQSAGTEPARGTATLLALERNNIIDSKGLLASVLSQKFV